MEKSFQNTDEYLRLFPEEVQEKLEGLRQLILSQSSGIEEYIGYQMPAFKYKGKPLVYFAGYKKHIGFYPGAEGIKHFERDFKGLQYKFSKGAVQFPVQKELPMTLIKKIIRFRIEEINKKILK